MNNKQINISQEQLQIIIRSLNDFKRYFGEEIYQAITNEITYLHFLTGNEITEFQRALNLIESKITEFSRNNRNSYSITDEQIPYLKQAMLFYRKQQANIIEEQKGKSLNPDLSKKLDDYLIPIDNILQSDWMKEVKPAPLPRIASFLSIESIDKFLGQKTKSSEREYDEKFHILQSPKLFLNDLEYFRKICEIRDSSIAVAYLDIDDFKKLNTKYSEVEIDRKVLPRFMQVLESFVYNHGFAYRYGGDEYIIILVNVSKEIANHLLKSLQDKIRNLKYQEVKESITISIGFCLVEPECYLTSREIEKKANEAKNFAKNSGKDCIATYKDENFELNSLYVSSKSSS